ncbi:hypothetical protein [Geodermatophilus maliterrae]|uniref:Uncharacterized protein n=1 Tax=Geodermatophilus maliterrae TaxID=3162531 RepID=A0ABV3XFW8_9ACTN
MSRSRPCTSTACSTPSTSSAGDAEGDPGGPVGTDRWVAVRSADRDPDFRTTTRVSDADFDVLVRNVFRVLLTRGLRGVRLHSTDPETQAFLDSLVG